MICGKKKNIEKIRNELVNRPLLYKGAVLKEKYADKWLGSMLSPQGIKESTIATIKERTIRILNIIHETIAIIEDSRMHRLGALRSIKEIWEIVILPALLSNSEMFLIQDKKI